MSTYLYIGHNFLINIVTAAVGMLNLLPNITGKCVTQVWGWTDVRNTRSQET